jgi:hypothetical protein
MRSLLAATALTSGALLFGGVAAAQAADTTITVNPGASGWSTSGTVTPGTGGFAAGPTGAPLGWGSYKLDTSSSNTSAKAMFMTNRHNGARLADVEEIKYTSFRQLPVGVSASNASLNIRARLSSTLSNVYLVYEPYWNHGNASIITGQWQTWDAIRGGAARWWSNSIKPNNAPCGMDNPCSWSTLLSSYPNATFYSSSYSFGLNQGTYNPGTVSYVDALTISINGNRTIYNFDPVDNTKPSCGSMVVRRGGVPGGEDEADVTVSDSGSGIASITNFTVSNGTFFIPPFTPGASSVTVTARKTDQNELTRFEFDVTDLAGNTIHCR